MELEISSLTAARELIESFIAYPYLFSYFKGEEWRTQRTVTALLDKYYTTRPDGIPGNDDAGTMSAWAVFSMMGFYPDCPGSPSYTLTTPRFSKVTLDLDPEVHGGESLEIVRVGEGEMIKAMTLNDKRMSSYRVRHSDLVTGNKLEIYTR